MSNGLGTIGLTYAGTDLQRSDLSLHLDLVRGLNEPPEVRGTDIVVPARTGRVAMARVADRLVIELRGSVRAGRDVVYTLPRKIGFHTYLSEDVASGATTIYVDSSLGLPVGTLISINGGQRTVTSRSGHALGINTSLSQDHVAGEPVDEITAETTLASPATGGDSTIDVTSANGIAIGDYLQIGESAAAGIRGVTNVAGTTISLSPVLSLSHSAGELVREVTYTQEISDRARYRTVASEVRSLFLTTRTPASLVALLEDGSTATITARPTSVVWNELIPSLEAEISVELEAVTPAWTIT